MKSFLGKLRRGQGDLYSTDLEQAPQKGRREAGGSRVVVQAARSEALGAEQFRVAHAHMAHLQRP